MDLRAKGPRVRVSITGETTVTGWALVDTGADVSFVDERAAEQVGMKRTGGKFQLFSLMCGCKNTSHEVDGSLKMGTLTAERVFAIELPPLGVIALIGRDVLAQCVLIYDGINNTFELRESAQEKAA